MKIIQCISTIDNSSGGPARSVTHLIQAILDLKEPIEFDLITLKSNNPIINKFESSLGNIVFLDSSFFGHAKGMKYLIRKKNDVLFHGQGIWEIPVHQMAKIARSKNIPYLISIRGMLSPWALEQSKIKKNIAFKLYQYRDLKEAVCLHATAPIEVENIRRLGFKNPIAMIPNGINIEDFSNIIPKKISNPKKIIFLSRIHYKKGIENLIYAWSQIKKDLRTSWCIEIIGNGDQKYILGLIAMIKKNGLSDEISIKKPVYGKEKIEIFRSASLFVLPTYSENFGIVIAEALASYTPVITTVGAPWKELETNNCGWWIDMGIQPLKNALIKAIESNEDDLLKMGKNGRLLIESRYSMNSVALQMLELYEWVLRKKNKPKFIDIYE
ncbi:glycosyltransferase [Lutibacter sp. HS1-25]|uniref:glycosyltransferase n=1 Tax=Lutibacter sp. HS1-25 TaxID=2485000 RepID=UPI001011171E|nr:glycosyltransferase [Lutibacter sp. HS1-25]RXP45399.1 glycosyltransferase [Lutibacter sp. HS1-25]